MCFWQEDHRGEVPSLPHDIRAVHHQDDIAVGVNLGPLA